MKKINLMDIMESLNNDNHEDAAAALHEWFVDQSKNVQARLSGQPVDEADTDWTKPDAYAPEPEAGEGEYDADIRQRDSLRANNPEAKEPTNLTGNPETDAAGWLEIATNLYHYFSEAVAYDRDDQNSYDEIAENAQNAIPLFKAGNVAAGVKALDTDSYTSEFMDGCLGGYASWFYQERHSFGESIHESEGDDCEDQEDKSENDSDEMNESYDALIAELAESFKGLETVSDKLQNVEGAQVGEQGKVPVNTKDTVPHHKGADRIAGKPVEIKGTGHKGHDLEKAPKVADVKIKGTVQNGKEELKKVADKGNASALLNKMDGKVNTQSPISGKGAKGLKK